MVKGRKIEIGSFLLLQIVVAATAANVTYDHRALVIDGKRKILISGSIHYPRSTPEVSLLYTYSYVYVTGWITKDGGFVVDVARPYTKIQGRWLGRYRDLRFLERSRA